MTFQEWGNGPMQDFFDTYEGFRTQWMSDPAQCEVVEQFAQDTLDQDPPPVPDVAAAWVTFVTGFRDMAHACATSDWDAMTTTNHAMDMQALFDAIHAAEDTSSS